MKKSLFLFVALFSNLAFGSSLDLFYQRLEEALFKSEQKTMCGFRKSKKEVDLRNLLNDVTLELTNCQNRVEKLKSMIEGNIKACGWMALFLLPVFPVVIYAAAKLQGEYEDEIKLIQKDIEKYEELIVHIQEALQSFEIKPDCN